MFKYTKKDINYIKKDIIMRGQQTEIKRKRNEQEKWKIKF